MSTQELINQLQATRKLEVKVGNITFTGICPRYSRLSKIINDTKDDSADAKMAALAIDGWDGVTEADIIKGGDSAKVIPFDQALFNELIFDRYDWWVPIARAITQSAMARQVVKEAEIKNSVAGTTPKRSRNSKEQNT